MPFERPARDAIYEQIIADIETDLPEADARLPYSDLNVSARALSAALYGLYGYESWAALQIHPDTADEDRLIRYASWWSIYRKPATAATGTATLSGTAGAKLDASTQVLWSGLTYTTDAEVTIPAGGSIEVALTAAEAGVAGNVPAGSKLKLTAPVADIASEMTTAAGLSGGTDIEAAEDLLARLLERMRTPPNGGSTADYLMWAKAVSGVTRAWVRRVEDEPGHFRVLIHFVMDGKTDTNIPTAAEVATVQAHIDAVRPVTAEATAAAPLERPINPVIRLNPATDAVKAAVIVELQDLLTREAEPGDGADLGTILLSHLREAISIAAGEYDNTLDSPVADFTVGNGEIAALGDVEWV